MQDFIEVTAIDFPIHIGTIKKCSARTSSCTAPDRGALKPFIKPPLIRANASRNLFAKVISFFLFIFRDLR